MLCFQTKGRRMSVQLALLLGAVLSLYGFCSLSDSKELTVKTQKGIRCQGHPLDNHSLAISNGDFAVRLYRLLAAQNPESNIIFSPLSVSMALAFLALGAHGPTRTEILQGLKFNLTKTPETDIHCGFQKLLRYLSQLKMPLQMDVNTAMFINQQLDLQENFQQEAQKLYAADIIHTDFQDPTVAKKLINDHVELKTHGKINKMVKGLDAQTRMVLVNSVLFQATWMMPFNPDYIFNSIFYMSPTSSWLNVPTMGFENKEIQYFWDARYSVTVVLFPYMESRVSMLLILPNNGAMPKLEAELNMDMIFFWRKSMSPRQMSLYVPKFSFSRGYNLEQVLPKLGIAKVFSQEADFSGLTTARKLSLSQVVHKTVLDVAEKGTEEAPLVGRSKLPTPRLSEGLDFNRPFLVAIISEDTQNILFLGKVENPNEVELPPEEWGLSQEAGPAQDPAHISHLGHLVWGSV